jgi:hypothetical protein
MPSNHTRWLLLSYRLAREPTRLRLAIWRRLKRVGAVLIHGGVWSVPLDAKTQEDFEWLAEEIEEAGGAALLWVAESLGTEQDRQIADRFRREADNRYAVLAAAARSIARAAGRRLPGPERRRRALRRLGGLQRTIRLERRRDYFRAPGRRPAEEAIAAAARQIETRFGHALDHPASLPR